MKKTGNLSLSLILGILMLVVRSGDVSAAQPDGVQTPGMLCSKSDPNFDKIDYPEQIVRCKRNVSHGLKVQVAHLYGDIPESEWPKYEFDHLIPLCVGGSDDIRNLWPEPIDEAHKKDVLENNICLAMKAGTLKQVDAVAKVHAWFEQNP